MESSNRERYPQRRERVSFGQARATLKGPSNGPGSAPRKSRRRPTVSPAPPRGHLITFEGIEGSGKSTQLAALADHLTARGCNVLVTREPGGTRLGEGIRRMLLDPQHRDMHPKTELLLYLASRAQHFEEIIEPALAGGRLILCDRFWDATFAYQGQGRNLDLKPLKSFQAFVTGKVTPDLTLLLDVEVRRGLERIQQRADADRLERERAAFYERVRAGYMKIAASEPDRVVLIDANQDFEQVAQEIRKTVDVFLEKHVVQRHHRA